MDQFIVSPLLVYSGKVDASKPMPEEFNRIYMHLFEDHGHGKLFSDNDNCMDDVLLLASQTYETWNVEEHQIGVPYRPSSHLRAVHTQGSTGQANIIQLFYSRSKELQ